MNVEQFLLGAKRNFRTIYYAAADGNAGDALINVGFYCLANRLGVKYIHLDISDDFSGIQEDELLIFSGGGYLNPHWPKNAAPIQRALQGKFAIVLLPQSVVGNEFILRELRDIDTVFARETYTLSYLRSARVRAAVYIDDDMAFHIDKKMVPVPSLSMPWSLKNAVRLAFFVWHLFRSRVRRSVDALRIDSESTSTTRPPLINDFSIIANYGVRTERENLTTAAWFLTLISLYKYIRTDRLHVIVGSVIMERDVKALPNNYFKVRGVLEKSILDNPKRRSFVNWDEGIQKNT